METVSGDTEFLPGVTLIQTPGHTVGSMSMQVDLPDTGTMIFTSDAVYMGESCGPPATPAAIVNNLEDFFASVEKLRGIQEQTNATMVFGHDAEQIKQLRKAPGGVVHVSSFPEVDLTEETIFTWGAPPAEVRRRAPPTRSASS